MFSPEVVFGVVGEIVGFAGLEVKNDNFLNVFFISNFLNIFFGVPHLATFISFFIEYVIAYIHPVYGGIRTHYLLDVSLLP